MIKKILLNNQEFHSDKIYLPIFIHGKEGSGASLFTMALLADFYSQGLKVIALTGFPIAREEFEKQTGSMEDAQFFTKEQRDEFIRLIHLSFPRRRESSSIKTETVILIKNIELFDEELLDTIKNYKNLIISGDITQCTFREKLLQKTFSTKIYFSPLDQKLPQLQKYHGYLTSSSINGVVSLKK